MRIGLLAPLRRYEDAFLEPAEPLFHASGDNLGNFAFVEALCRHLAPDVTILPWDVTREEARERCDLLVFAAANQLGAHNDLGDFADHLESLGLPLVAVGLGAQAASLEEPVDMPAGTRRWARVLAGLAPNGAPNIGVRGEFSLRALERLGLDAHAVVTGCPSNFLNDRPDFYTRLQQRVDARRIDRLCVAAGSPHFAPVRHLERRLAELVEITGGLYVAQADLNMVRFARGESERIEPEERELIRAFVAPDLAGEAFEIWRKRHALCFTDATSWMEAMRSCDFAVGARFHGVMLALQAGAPGGVIAHDSRTLELCRTMALPVRQGHEFPDRFGLDDLPSLFAFDVARYAAARERLRQAYVSLLRGCGIEPHARLTTSQALP